MLFALIGIVLLLIWIVTMIDVFRRHDLSTAGRCGWALVVLLIPIIGLIAYYIARPPDAIDIHTSEDAGTAEASLRSRHPA
jgi:uncharacterized membrane protein YhaH (DUF805 family)